MEKKYVFYKKVMVCPKCGKQHVDEGIWAKRLHHKHLCLHCKHVWELEDYVFGVTEEELED